MKRRAIHAALAAACVALCFSLPALAQTRVRPGFNLFTVEQDVQVGRQSAAQVERQLPLVRDGGVNRYISRLGARLGARAPGARFSYRFRVVNLSDVNAFALPGGYVYVHRGLLERVRTEGELAGVLAHEIAHVALRHPTNQVSKAYVARAGVGVLGTLLGERTRATTGRIMEAVGGFGLNALFLRYSRKAESEADIVGAQIMAEAGYDPMEMARFFAYLKQRSGSEPSKIARFLSDHPPPSDREARVRKEAQMLGPDRRVAPIGSLVSVQATLRRMPPAPTRQQLAQR